MLARAIRSQLTVSKYKEAARATCLSLARQVFARAVEQGYTYQVVVLNEA
jgi:hypothetical protein